MSEYNIQMNKYNALNAQYDQLYPVTKIEDVDGLDTALQKKADTSSVYTKTETNTLLQKKVNPNLLDNWYFGNPINQRGQTSYTGEVYGIDRWIAQWTGDGVTLIEDGCVSIYRSFSDSYLCQRITDDLGGQTVTFSAICKGTCAVKLVECDSGWAFKSFIAQHDTVVINDYTLLTVTGIVPQGCRNLIVELLSAPGVKSQFKAAKLELGSQQTFAHQENGVWLMNEIPDYGEQLARCQRELYRDGGSDFTSVGYGLAESGKTAYFLVKLPVPMRVRPSVTYAGNWIVWDGVTGRAIESISINVSATNPKDCSFVNIKVDITGSDLTIGKMYQLCVRSDKSAYIEFIC